MEEFDEIVSHQTARGLLVGERYKVVQGDGTTAISYVKNWRLNDEPIGDDDAEALL